MAFIAAVSLLAACSTSDDPFERAPKPVRVIVAETTEIPLTASLSGIIAPQAQQNLAFRVEGKVADIAVEVGDHVDKDMKLASIDPRDLRANVELANAAVTAAEARASEAQTTFDRQNALFANGNTTRANLDRARTALDAATSALASARAKQASANEALGYSDLDAIADGVVVVRRAEPGQVVQAGQPVLAIAVDGPRDAVFQVDDRRIAGMPDDTKVLVTLLSNPDIRATGHAREYSPALDAVTSTVRIKVGLDRETPEMPLGATVTGEIVLDPLRGIVLPWAALTRDKRGPAVWTIETNANTARLMPVVVDRYLDTAVVVSSGISDGDMVVVSGVDMMLPGEVVTPRLEASK